MSIHVEGIKNTYSSPYDFNAARLINDGEQNHLYGKGFAVIDAETTDSSEQKPDSV